MRCLFRGRDRITIGGKSIVYAINYYAGHPDSVSEVMSIGILGAGIGIPLWTLVARQLSKRWVWMIGASGAALVNLALFFLDVTAVSTLSALIFSMESWAARWL